MMVMMMMESITIASLCQFRLENGDSVGRAMYACK